LPRHEDLIADKTGFRGGFSPPSVFLRYYIPVFPFPTLQLIFSTIPPGNSTMSGMLDPFVEAYIFFFPPCIWSFFPGVLPSISRLFPSPERELTRCVACDPHGLAAYCPLLPEGFFSMVLKVFCEFIMAVIGISYAFFLRPSVEMSYWGLAVPSCSQSNFLANFPFFSCRSREDFFFSPILYLFFQLRFAARA